MGELLRRTGERARSLAVVAALLALTPSMAAAGNLIVNGGFETGDFTGWEVSAAGGIGVKNLSGLYFKQTTPPRSGSYAAVLGGAGSITQRVPTISGEMYDLTFYVNASLPNRLDYLDVAVAVDLGTSNDTVFALFFGGAAGTDNGYQKVTLRFTGPPQPPRVGFTVLSSCAIALRANPRFVCPVDSVSPLYPFLVDDVSLELVKRDTQQVNFQGGPLPKIGGETQVDLPGQGGPQGAGGGGVPPIASPEPGTLGLMLAAGGAAMLFRSQRNAVRE